MKNTWEHTVSIHFVKVLIDSIKKDGFDINAVLERAQISRDLLEIRDARITPNQLAKAIESACALYDDELMGLSQKSVRLGVLSLAAKYAIQAQTLEAALFRWQKFYSTVTDAYTFNIIHGERYTDIQLQFEKCRNNGEQLLTEYLLLITHRLSSWLVGQFIPLEYASFCYEEPWYAREYQLMYACPCEFSHEYNAIRIPNSYMKKAIIQSKTSLSEYFEELPGAWFKRQDYHQHTAGQVVKALMTSEQLRGTQITDIAAQLNITDRTLRRRLLREGTSFQTLKDNFRRDKAIDLLAKSSLSVAEIAQELGFAEPNAFTRAFKQWTGSTPKSYRQH